MLCRVCKFNIHYSCEYFHNDFTTEMLCIFKQLPNDIIHYLTQFLYFYEGHIVSYYDIFPPRSLCTSCFHVGYYNYCNTNKIITHETFMNYFSYWMDDKERDKIILFCSKKFLPKKI
jgi:hypothetical protein